MVAIVFFNPSPHQKLANLSHSVYSMQRGPGQPTLSHISKNVVHCCPPTIPMLRGKVRRTPGHCQSASLAQSARFRVCERDSVSKNKVESPTTRCSCCGLKRARTSTNSHMHTLHTGLFLFNCEHSVHGGQNSAPDPQKL